jgi:hypothetical protein
MRRCDAWCLWEPGPFGLRANWSLWQIQKATNSGRVRRRRLAREVMRARIRKDGVRALREIVMT